MNNEIYREIHLVNRPEELPQESDFKIEKVETQPLQEGEVRLRTLYLSVDPYMRGRMRDAKSYVDPFKLNEALSGGALAEVVESNDASLQPGEIVTGHLKWAEFQAADAMSLQKVDPEAAPITTRLGILGMTGFTAYFGLLEICNPKEGETVVVSGAAGAVGLVAVQLAKIRGARVVGIAGSDKKIDYLREELGVDVALNYKKETFFDEVQEALKDGVDVYFDNVGGEISDAVMMNLNKFARISLCGAISSYNKIDHDLGPRMQWKLIQTSSMMKGFIVGDYADDLEKGSRQLTEWLHEGKLKYEETIIEGFENTPKSFIGLFKGENIGKQLVKVADRSE